MNFFLWILGSLCVWNTVSNIINDLIVDRLRHPMIFCILAKESTLFASMYVFSLQAGFSYPETIAGVLVGIDVAASFVTFLILYVLENFLRANKTVLGEVIYLLRTIRLAGMSLYIMGWAVQSGIIFSTI